MNSSRIIACDFDGTIVENEFPQIGAPKRNAFEVLQRLRGEGFTLILWTCRKDESLIEALEYLRSEGVQFDYVNENSDEILFPTSQKIFYSLLIDDRQLGGIPDDWEEIYSMIRRHFDE